MFGLGGGVIYAAMSVLDKESFCQNWQYAQYTLNNLISAILGMLMLKDYMQLHSKLSELVEVKRSSRRKKYNSLYIWIRSRK